MCRVLDGISGGSSVVGGVVLTAGLVGTGGVLWWRHAHALLASEMVPGRLVLAGASHSRTDLDGLAT